nr:hemolymph clottable protein-like [Cherax quadricarinatus]
MIRLREELAEHCDSETVHPLPLEIITSPLYDHAHFKAQWTEDYPLILKNLTNSLNDIVDGILFPLVSYDHTATNPEYTREIDATKDLDTNRWTIRDKRPNLVAVTSDLKVPVLFQEFLSPAKITRTFNYNFIEGRTSSTCFIKTTKVVTFDGVAFPYQADSCWVTIAISYGQYDGTQYRLNSMAKARFTDQWEVQAIWPWGGLVIDITKSHILINGEDYEGENQFVKFTKNENASMFFFKSLGFVIIISDKIQFRMPKILNGNLHGLCGRMDGEKRHDLVGPTGCIFTNPSLFALSWTTQGEGCSLFSLRSKKRGVTQYQEACPREDYTPTAVSHPSVVYDCTEWEYKELTTGDVRCIANEPTPVCKPGCKKTSDTRKPIEYDCTITGSDQPEAYCQSSGQGRNLTKECFPHTRVTTYPASCLPQ